MATLGTPTKDESGRLIQRWYPVEGDIRPEGLEYEDDELGWIETSHCGKPVTQPGLLKYRIPSTYTPPDGWYCVDDEETVQEGDCYSDDLRRAASLVGMGVARARRQATNGGWVLRREPVGFPETTARNAATALDPGLVNAINEHLEQPCQSESESAESVTEKADSTSVCRDTTGPESGTGASSATAPVAWQFRKQPMKQIVDHYRLLAADEIVSSDCLWWSSATCQWLTFGEACHGQPLPDIQAPACRPVYAPLPTRLEDVPDGRVFQVNMERYWKHSLGYGFWGSNGEVDPDVALPVSPITITDYVAELKAVE